MLDNNYLGSSDVEWKFGLIFFYIYKRFQYIVFSTILPNKIQEYTEIKSFKDTVCREMYICSS